MRAQVNHQAECMAVIFHKPLLILLGWLFTLLGLIGAFLPILPTTPFLILALVLFSKSSPRFHQMLLRNKWFGPTLRQWDEHRILPRPVKIKATALIIITFALSIVLLSGSPLPQILLIALAIVLLIFIWRIKERR